MADPGPVVPICIRTTVTEALERYLAGREPANRSRSSTA